MIIADRNAWIEPARLYNDFSVLTEALIGHLVKSRLVIEFRVRLKRLNREYNIKLCLVPDDYDIESNEIVDERINGAIAKTSDKSLLQHNYLSLP